MADIATYIGVEPRTIKLQAATGRGIRVTRQSDGTCAIQDATARGDYVTLRDGAINESIDGVATGTPAEVPALASEAASVGDLAYTAAAGQFCKTATSAVLIGRWTQAASGAGVLGAVQLFSVA